jgi:serine protease AprX
MTDDTHHFDRRTVLKATGAASVGLTLPFSGTAAASDDTIDDSFDLTSDGLKESLVVFESNDDVDRLGTLDLANGYHKFEALPVGYTELTTDQIEEVATWDSVRYVRKNVELEFHNDDARETTRADAVQSDLGYEGSSVHSAVIDSGVDGDHPDLDSSVVKNWQWAGNPLDEPTLWIGAGDADTDDNGHGTHCSGSIAGDGTKSEGQYKGLAPNADLTVYSTGLTLLVVKSVAAYDHLLARVRDGAVDVRVVSNSYGVSNGDNFNPDDPLNVATWEAHREGLLSLFSAGNSGPDTNTLNQYAKGPHVLGVGATDDQKHVTDFSSRGRSKDFNGNGSTNWGREEALNNLETYHETGSASGPVGVYRPGVGATGELVMSTLEPTDPLQAYYEDTETWYGRISGTSMSCPVTAGAATLVIDAYEKNNGDSPAPIDVLNTLEAEAEDVHDSYTPYNIGTGFVAAYDAVVRAEDGNLASFSDVTLVN